MAWLTSHLEELGEGMQWMQNEFYYLDGTETLHENKGSADYNLAIGQSLAFIRILLMFSILLYLLAIAWQILTWE